MTRILFLLSMAGLALSACNGPSGSLVVGGDDDDAVANDDDAVDDDDAIDDDDGTDDDDAVDDDDVMDDDDATPPILLEEGFFVWDATVNENGTPGANYFYLVLPRGSLPTCQALGENEGDDVDYDYIAIWGFRGPDASWEGEYGDIYSGGCDWKDEAARCFSAWGYDGSWQNGWESSWGDTFTISAWSGVEASGFFEVGNEETGWLAQNCGKFDFMDEGGEETDPDPGNAKAERPEQKPKGKKPSTWSLRFR
jgi:hypothetical protein